MNGPSRAVRFAMCAFLLVLGTGVFGVNAWPFTDWRLFAGLRHETTAGWSAMAVDANGTEHPVDFSALGRHYAGSLQIMQGFPRLDPRAQAAVCFTWLEAAEEKGSPLASIRLYRTTVATRTGKITERSLAHTCATAEL